MPLAPYQTCHVIRHYYDTIYKQMTITLVANSLGQLQVNTEDYSSNYYAIVKFSIRSDVPRKYYERRIRQFLDFIILILKTMI